MQLKEHNHIKGQAISIGMMSNKTYMAIDIKKKMGYC